MSKVSQNGVMEKVLTIPQDQTEIIEFNVKGVTPLIVHKFSEKIIKQLEEKKSGAGKKGRENCDPEREYLDALHICEDGTPGFPASGFKLSMVRASKNLGHKMTDVRTSFVILADDLVNQYVYINGEHEMRTDWVKVGNGGADIRYRPMFKKWSAELKIKFNPNYISAEQLATLLKEAGAFVGIGEWRPSSNKSGSYGTFELVS